MAKFSEQYVGSPTLRDLCEEEISAYAENAKALMADGKPLEENSLESLSFIRSLRKSGAFGEKAARADENGDVPSEQNKKA